MNHTACRNAIEISEDDDSGHLKGAEERDALYLVPEHNGQQTQNSSVSNTANSVRNTDALQGSQTMELFPTKQNYTLLKCGNILTPRKEPWNTTNSLFYMLNSTFKFTGVDGVHREVG